MSKTQTIEEYPVQIDGDHTIPAVLFGFRVDPGDGDTIMAYVDATPEDDERRFTIVPVLAAAPKLLEACEKLEPPARAVTDIMHRRTEADPILNARLSELWQAINKARAAIAAARPETPSD